MGLSFSRASGVALPSARNISNSELISAASPDLGRFDVREQGVSLLQSSADGPSGAPRLASGTQLQGGGVTQCAIDALSSPTPRAARAPLVAILWGRMRSHWHLGSAEERGILTHPLPRVGVSRDFFGSQPFSRAGTVE